MLTCQALQQFSLEKPPAVMLGRSPEVQSKYDKFMKEKTNRGGFIEKMKENLKGKKFHFVINDFPYHTVKGIEHWVCWYSSEEDPSKIIDELKEKYDVITCWKNLSHNMSIQEINHIHVFINID